MAVSEQELMAVCDSVTPQEDRSGWGKLNSGYQSPCHHGLVFKPFHSYVAGKIFEENSVSVKFRESRDSMQPYILFPPRKYQ